jgi:hypothetical protein
LFTENEKILKFNELKRRLPVLFYSKVAPFMGKQHQKNSEKMIKTLERGN